VISLIILCSSFSSANTGVLLGTGGACVIAYLLSMIPKMQLYTPMRLTESMPLLTGVIKPGDVVWATAVTALLIGANTVIAVLVFNKRKI